MAVEHYSSKWVNSWIIYTIVLHSWVKSKKLQALPNLPCQETVALVDQKIARANYYYKRWVYVAVLLILKTLFVVGLMRQHGVLTPLSWMSIKVTSCKSKMIKSESVFAERSSNQLSVAGLWGCLDRFYRNRKGLYRDFRFCFVYSLCETLCKSSSPSPITFWMLI